jgi:hypothetical protein
MPPEVPATVKANVPEVVIGEPETEIKPPVKDCATLETVPVAPPEEASNVTTPELFFEYSFMSAVLSANSPLARFAANGTAEAVVL